MASETTGALIQSVAVGDTVEYVLLQAGATKPRVLACRRSTIDETRWFVCLRETLQSELDGNFEFHRRFLAGAPKWQKWAEKAGLFDCARLGRRSAAAMFGEGKDSMPGFYGSDSMLELSTKKNAHKSFHYQKRKNKKTAQYRRPLLVHQVHRPFFLHSLLFSGAPRFFA